MLPIHNLPEKSKTKGSFCPTKTPAKMKMEYPKYDTWSFIRLPGFLWAVPWKLSSTKMLNPMQINWRYDFIYIFYFFKSSNQQKWSTKKKESALYLKVSYLRLVFIKNIGLSIQYHNVKWKILQQHIYYQIFILMFLKKQLPTCFYQIIGRPDWQKQNFICYGIFVGSLVDLSPQKLISSHINPK